MPSRTDRVAVSDTAASDPSSVTRVRRSPAEAQRWYSTLSRWYGTVATPFEAAALDAGLSLLDASPGESVLDVGTGTGEALAPLAEAVGDEGRVVGVDIASGMCRVARETIVDAGVADRATVACADARGLPLRDDTVDAMLASFTLELFDTPRLGDVLAEWQRVLGDDGRLCVVALSKRPETVSVRAYERLHEAFPRYLDCRPIYVRATLREAGFEVARALDLRLWGLPVTVALARPASG